MSVVQMGTDVTAVGEGSFNLAAFSGPDVQLSFPQMLPGGADLILGIASITSVDVYIGISGPSSFGTTNSTEFADSGTGGAAGIFFPATDLWSPLDTCPDRS